MIWRLFCKHNFEKTYEAVKVTTLTGIETNRENIVYVYCPNCSKRKKLTEIEWEVTKKEQEIYRKSHKELR